MRFTLFKTHNYCNKIKFSHQQIKFYNTLKPPWNVLFFGADSFSLSSLERLHNEYKGGRTRTIKKLEVVTSTSTTSVGKKNVIEKFARQHNLPLHKWPLNLGDRQGNCFDVGLVVSFGHLIPEKIINIFPLGMLNVHASLLPRWRGAAPIIYSIAKGDEKTGITIMTLKPDKFDIGEIVSQVSVDINGNMKMPELYGILAESGAQELVECLRDLPGKLKNAKPQSDTGVTYAPKIDSSFAHVKWSTMSAKEVYNLHRALDTLYPLKTTWRNVTIKLYDVEECTEASPGTRAGTVEHDKSNKCLRVVCGDGNSIRVRQIGVQGKKVMSASDFDNGYLKKEPCESRVFQ